MCASAHELEGWIMKRLSWRAGASSKSGQWGLTLDSSWFFVILVFGSCTNACMKSYLIFDCRSRRVKEVSCVFFWLWGPNPLIGGILVLWWLCILDVTHFWSIVELVTPLGNKFPSFLWISFLGLISFIVIYLLDQPLFSLVFSLRKVPSMAGSVPYQWDIFFSSSPFFGHTPLWDTK